MRHLLYTLIISLFCGQLLAQAPADSTGRGMAAVPEVTNLPYVRGQVGYPRSAVVMGALGRVVVRAYVASNGRALKYELAYTPNVELGNAVMQHVDKLRFTAVQTPREEPWVITIPFDFALSNYMPKVVLPIPNDAPNREDEKLIAHFPQLVNMQQRLKKIKFPKYAKIAGRDGRVVIAVLVSGAGNFKAVQFLESTSSDFGQAIEPFFDGLLIQGGSDGGQRVDKWMYLEFNFYAEDESITVDFLHTHALYGYVIDVANLKPVGTR